MILLKIIHLLTCFENNVNASLHNRTEALKVYQSKSTAFLICQIKSNDLSCLRQFDEFFQKLSLPICFCFVYCSSWRVKRHRKFKRSAGKTRERNSKQKKMAQERTKKLAWPALGSPKTLAQMPEGYAFALLITQ